MIERQLEGFELYNKQKQIKQNLENNTPIIVADNLKTPENIGSILRLSEAVGCQKIIFINEESSTTIKYFNRIRKTATGAEKLVDWEFKTYQELLEQKFLDLYTIVAIEITDKSTNVFNTSLPTNCIFVIGNESYGISENLLKKCDYSVHIPMYGLLGSMNVSHALAIVLYEWKRQQYIKI